MQPEPIALSQKTLPVDSSQLNRTPTQHGNDSADGTVSGSLECEAVRDQSVSNWPLAESSSTPLNDVESAPPSPAQRISQYENAGLSRGESAELGSHVAPSSGSSNLPLESLPNEVLTHILSHLPPQSLSAITLVSRRLYALVTTPHAWRIAFSRFFPGPQAAENGGSPVDQADVASDRRYFARLTALASWRSEYILRTRLMRSLSRGKPAQFQLSKKYATVRSAVARNGSAVSTYTSQLLFPVSHIHGTFNNPDKEPSFIHGASEQGIASASDPSAVKVSTWGLADHQMFRHFADIFPGDAQYGLGAGEMVGMPNSMDVSQPYGMIYGEGCPQGRSYFISTTEQRGRFLGLSDLGSHPQLGIPAVNMITHAICSVWIAKSASILKATGGLVAMMSGSSSGILSSYALGPHPTYERRYERGQVTARWALCPGVPIIGIAVDDNFSTRRHSQRRVWAVVLNALGEIFYLTEIPRQPEVPSNAKLNAEQSDELAWKTGRTVRWELLEMSRRTARPDPFNLELVDGSYSPRSSSDSMQLDPNQIAAETREIEKYLSFKPKHFRKVDFAGDDGKGAGESVVVLVPGTEGVQDASIRRFIRGTSETHLPSSTTGGSRDPVRSLFGGPVGNSSPSLGEESIPPSRSSVRSAHENPPLNTEWRVSDFVFGDRKPVEITTAAIDNSTFATITADEDPLLGMSGSSHSSAISSPVLPHLAQPRSSFEVPGQRARYLAVGTATGSIFVWDMRALASQHADVINSIAPVRVIQTESPRVSCVALTSLYLVHGGNDGLVQAWDPLASSTRPIRTLNSRFSSRARRRLVQAELSTLGVGNNYFAASAICLDPDPTVLRGMVSLGTHLRYWSYSSSGADQYKSNKRRLRRTARSSNGVGDGQRFTTSGRGAIQDFIEDERIEIERQSIEDAKERAHLSNRFGVDLLGPDVDEEQLLAYAQLLSEEAYTSASAKRGDQTAIASSVTSTSLSDAVGPSSFGIGGVSSSSSPNQDPIDDQVDDDLAEAIRLSLLDSKATPEPFDQTPSIPIKYAKGVQKQLTPSPPRMASAGRSDQKEMDDLEFAIQLSLAENRSREEPEEWEEFPALSPPLSSTRSSGKGKGRARA
ncbi:hypothetical protein N7468_003633 [Penicillium chermesinum]|uniref:F-box domain-containing protein n=1 Tax=Penicillium chermesinum TaxID=63820 RepID=A0A9W9P6S8_9EURO|nr:uncharacterized protein N7468_003633 [Penicillium chermesinum]KAJ5239014.1 hypothetical protein N7468_003633 [Penicillium chermesinum]